METKSSSSISRQFLYDEALLIESTWAVYGENIGQRITFFVQENCHLIEIHK